MRSLSGSAPPLVSTGFFGVSLVLMISGFFFESVLELVCLNGMMLFFCLAVVPLELDPFAGAGVAVEFAAPFAGGVVGVLPSAGLVASSGLASVALSSGGGVSASLWPVPPVCA